MDDLLGIINQRMHGAVSCPTLAVNPLGECPIIEREGKLSWLATLCFWRDPIGVTADEVVRWFRDAGCTHISIRHELWNEEATSNGVPVAYVNGRDGDGVALWLVSFRPPARGGR